MHWCVLTLHSHGGTCTNHVLQFPLILGFFSAMRWGPAAAAAALPAAASPELMQQGWEIKSPWFQRDVPLSYDVLLENFTDPAHVPQSHHGVVVSAGCFLCP